MARSLDVYLLNQFIGRLEQNADGDMVFQYLESWLARPNAVALSQSLPLRAEHFSHRECRAFFGGMLPEGQVREKVARNLGISARNDVRMLEAIGGECAGAVTLLPTDEAFPLQANDCRMLTDSQLADVLRQLPRRPLLAGEDHIRLSLAGAQDKMAVRLVEAQICLPLDGAASTHILKPAVADFEDIAANEWLCMRLAQAVGLKAASVEMRRVEEIDYLLIERYDRIRGEDGSIVRLHQEDFCQAMGIVSERKYQNEGGPSLMQCFDLLRRVSSVPAVEIGRLLNAVAFNFLIGNNDAHSKNFSLLYTFNVEKREITSLASLYDLVCTACYPELSGKMAMKIGGEYELARVTPRHFERFAEETGLSKPLVKRRVLATAKQISSKVLALASEKPEAIGLAEFLHTRCSQVTEMFAG